MVDKEHLRIFKQGVKAFNEWWEEAPDIEPQLAKVDLSKAIRLKDSGGYSMFDDFEVAYKWELPKYEYENDQILIESVSDKIIEPAVAKLKELRGS